MQPKSSETLCRAPEKNSIGRTVQSDGNRFNSKSDQKMYPAPEMPNRLHSYSRLEEKSQPDSERLSKVFPKVDTCANNNRCEVPHPTGLMWLIFICTHLLDTVARHSLDFDNPSENRCLCHRADPSWRQPSHSDARLGLRPSVGERRPRVVTPPVVPSGPRLSTPPFSLCGRPLLATCTIVSA